MANLVENNVEAFCADITETQKGLDLEVSSLSACLSSELAASRGVAEAANYADAYLLGCSSVAASEFTTAGLTPDEAWDTAVSFCYQLRFESWSEDDYEVTSAGLCFYPVDLPDLPGCRDGGGNLVTPPQPDYSKGADGYLEAIADFGVTSIAVGRDPEVALEYGQDLCTELRRYGGTNFADFHLDVEHSWAGTPLVSGSEWPKAGELITDLAGLASGHLFPELADTWGSALGAARDFYESPDWLAYGGAIGEAAFMSGHAEVQELWDRMELRDTFDDIGLELCNALDGGAGRDRAFDLAAEQVTSMVESAFPSPDPLTIFFYVDKVQDSALSRLCPRHDVWRWMNLNGDFDIADLP